jgi:2-polyprenyl-6-methoxyphenol hydroxylase-like FAD-dependent oxidoreductase
MAETDVLIAGAGPTGLVLAIWLRRLGVRFRIIDSAERPATNSRALAVQARTLEFYRQIGLADKIIAAGFKFAAVNLWVAGRRAARVPIDGSGGGISPFPYILILPQDIHEKILSDHLTELGIHVDRGTELVSFEASDHEVNCLLRKTDGREESGSALFLCGCDGAHSKVRKATGIDFPGDNYAHLFYVADVEATGSVMNRELNVGLDSADFLAVFPLKQEGNARLIGTVRYDAKDSTEDFSWNDVSSGIFERLKIQVSRVNWFSTYRVSHRVTRQFRKGRVFLMGDAAHIHSPVGGQGMNTGIGDAVNLSWKLAAALQTNAVPELLDSYEDERRAFALRLVATTDRMFTVATRAGPLARMIRLHVVPPIASFLSRFQAMRRFLFRTVSQTALCYRGCALNRGRAGSLHAGDRLPWIPSEGDHSNGDDNFTPLESLQWQLHVVGLPNGDIVRACDEHGVATHSFPWNPAAKRAGFVRDAVYLVRPDGYVAFADPRASVERLEAALGRWSVNRPKAPGAPLPVTLDSAPS